MVLVQQNSPQPNCDGEDVAAFRARITELGRNIHAKLIAREQLERCFEIEVDHDMLNDCIPASFVAELARPWATILGSDVLTRMTLAVRAYVVPGESIDHQGRICIAEKEVGSGDILHEHVVLVDGRTFDAGSTFSDAQLGALKRLVHERAKNAI